MPESANEQIKRLEYALTSRATDVRSIIADYAPCMLVFLGHTFTQETGKIMHCPTVLDQTFGYVDGQLLGQNIKLLIKPEYHDRHDKHMAGFIENPILRAMAGFVGRRRNGSDIPIAIQLNPKVLNGVLCCLATILERPS